ncbi:DUF4120 family protein [Rhodoferax sp.]|uniref:DUF4120 family protein n=1 Tax=Rhodoferax sp. TaxID=50421 RepID=UPI002747579B|nr:DUF4120 family protein [Rhodoferax sp.]
MIKIENPEHFVEVLTFAVHNNCAAKLLERLDYLAHYAEGDNVCHVYADHAPNSFAFAMKRPDDLFWFNGGLIYSGPDQPLDGSAPALTVGIGIDSSVHGWSIHT